MNKLAHLTFSFLTACAAPLVSVADVAGQDTGTRRALLIGINEYESRSNLNGCVNDVEVISTVLRTRFGFESKNVLKLLNGDATRERILSEMRRVVADSGERDVLFIHFSGHGSYHEDYSGDETDGNDETLCPADSYADGVPDILDDEIDLILSELRTPHAVIVLDSCHSGTGTREAGARVRTRGESPDHRDELYRELAASLPERPTGIERQYVFLSSATSEQKALDGEVDNVYRGFFSAALTNVLGRCSPHMPIKELWSEVGREYARVQLRHAARFTPRTPRLEAYPAARVERPLVMPTSEPTVRRPFLMVRGASRTVLLVGGARDGAAIGSTWALYPEGDRDMAPGQAIGQGVIVKHRGADAVLRLTHAPKEQHALRGARAILTAPPMSDRHVPVKLKLPLGRREEAQRLLVQLVPDAQVVSNDGETYSKFQIKADEDGSTLHLLTEGSDTPILTTRSVEEAATALGCAVLAGEMAALENPASLMSVTVSLAGREDIASTVIGRGIEYVAENASPDVSGTVRISPDEDPTGDFFAFEIEAYQDCYITIVGLDQAGEIDQVYPHKDSIEAGNTVDGAIAGFESVQIPAPGKPKLRATRLGDQQVFVFATEDLATAEVIRDTFYRLDERWASGDRDHAGMRDAIAELRETLLGASLDETSTRGIVQGGKPSAGKRPDEIEEEDLDVDEAAFSFDDEDFADEDDDAGSIGDWTVASITIRVVPQ